MLSVHGFSQNVKISSSAGDIKPSAILDLDVSGDAEKKGLLIPRMEHGEMTSIISPATSLLVYTTDSPSGYYFFDGSDWKPLAADDLGNHTATETINTQGHWISGDGTSDGLTVSTSNDIGIGISSPNANLHVDGTVRMNDLSGTGTRMVVADADGDLSTQSIPSSGPGGGSTLNLHLTSHTTDVDVSGVSYIYVTTNGNHDVKGFTGGVTNQVINLINRGTVDDVKFKKDEGTQEFLKELNLKKEEGAIVMFDGTDWFILSKH